MSSVVTFNGSSYIIPATGDTGWGNNVSSYLIAIAAGALQKSGGAFTLSAETDFGSSFGLKSLYYKSRTSNPSATGILRLANNSDSVSWRNAANNADLSLFVNSSNQLIFNGDVVPVPGTRILLPDGSTAAPSLSFLLDQDLGLYRAGSNDMRVSAGNKDTVEFRNTETQFDTVVKVKGPRPFADVTAYGAVGDGVTDDLAAIQAAIEAVTDEGGGDVLLPAGNYSISNQILVHSRVSLLGAGQKVTTITCASGFPSGRDCIHFGPNDSQNYTSTGGGEYIVIKDMTLRCDNMPVGVGYGIAALGVDYTTIDHVSIFDTQAYGIIVSGTDATYNMLAPLVQYCYFNNCGRYGGGDTLGGGYNSDARYLFNVFENCNGTAIDNVHVLRALWMGNHSIGNAASKGGIWSDFGMLYSTISHNFIDHGTIHIYGYLGAGLEGAPTGVTICNNYLSNSSSSAILISAANQSSGDTRQALDIKITDNEIDGCDDVAINLGDSPGALVSNNRIRNWDALSGGYAAINLSSGLNPTIGTNKCLISGNSGVVGNSSLWYKEFVTAGPCNQNQIQGNNFPGGTTTLVTSSPVSILEYTESASSALHYDANTFVVDYANHRVGFGTAVPSVFVDIAGGAVKIRTTTNQLLFGDTTTTTINAPIPAASRVYTIPDAGGSANFLLSGWGQIVNADISASAAISVSKLAALTVSRAVVTDGSGFISAATTTATEIGYVNGVTSSIQTQINTKAPTASPTFTGTVTIPTPFTLGAVSVTATGTEINYLVGVTSAIQTQLGLKAPLASPTFTGTVTMPNTAITDTSNQLVIGTTRTVTLTAPTPASSSRTVTIPDLSANYSVVGTEAAQTINGDKTLSGVTTISGTSGNTLVVDTNTLIVDATNNRVGIGTTAPNYALEVIAGQNIAIGQQGSNNTTIGDLRFATGGTSDRYAAIRGVRGADAAQVDLRFLTIAGDGGGVTERMRISNTGSVVLGTLGSALATSATDGFGYMPTCAGTPTGVPTSFTGKVAWIYDTSNNKFYVYNGAWKSVTLA